MPVYGQDTEFHRRLCSLLSCVLCNTNHLYHGSGNARASARKTANHNAWTEERPLFADIILRKAEMLRAHRPRRSKAATPPVRRPVEIVLVVDAEQTGAGGNNNDDNYYSYNYNNNNDNDNDNNIRSVGIPADLVSKLFLMPDDGSGNEFRLRVVAVRSHSMREDLMAGGGDASNPEKHPETRGQSPRRVFVALGSAIRGLETMLLRRENARRKRPQTKANPRTPRAPPPPCLGIVCVDPPPRACARLREACPDTMPLLVVGYDDDRDEDDEDRAGGPGLLTECLSHPATLVVVARSSARIVFGDAERNDKRNRKRKHRPAADGNARFWLARLVTKYTEALLRLETPPGSPRPTLSRL